MKKYLVSALFIFTFAGYVISTKIEDSDEVNVIPPSPKPSDLNSLSLPQRSSSSITKGLYKNGEYTGNVVDAFYGNVQVKVVISEGKISDVVFLEYPNDRRTSIQINKQAMPYLKQEAIQSQSASVDIVSGATQTSRAFIVSLNTALEKAKI